MNPGHHFFAPPLEFFLHWVEEWIREHIDSSNDAAFDEEIQNVIKLLSSHIACQN